VRRKLQEQRAELIRQDVELGEESGNTNQGDLAGDTGLDDDFADAGTATFDRERDFSIRNNIQDLIDQIDRATARIDAGTYGLCESCGRPIEAARLKALPHASLCLNCKRRDERTR
jgi:DnaK suppressor protein